MKEVTDKNFGVIIANWLPGFMLLWGLSLSFDQVASWFNIVGEPSIAEFLYSTVASLSLGLIIGAVRWATVDKIVGCITNLPPIDFSKLKDKDAFAVFQGLNENHYRYYQYNSNTLVSTVVVSLAFLIYGKHTLPWWAWLGVILLCLVLFFASRDALQKYHERASSIGD
jgi:hypothetical protein